MSSIQPSGAVEKTGPIVVNLLWWLCHVMGGLAARQQCYNDVRGWYSACIEQLFARLWHWGLVRNIWCHGPDKLHQFVRILLHFPQFCIRRQVCQLRSGPWDHVLPHVWIGATRPPPRMRERMRWKCVRCVVTSAPPSPFVVSVRSTIVPNVLTPTLVGIILFFKHILSGILCC